MKLEIYRPCTGYQLCKATINGESKRFIAKSIEIVNGVVTFIDVKFSYYVTTTIQRIPNLSNALGRNQFGNTLPYDYYFRNPMDFHSRCESKCDVFTESYSEVEKIIINIDNFEEATQCNEETIKSLCPWGFINQEDALQKSNENVININKETKKSNEWLLNNLYDNALSLKTRQIYNDRTNAYNKAVNEYDKLHSEYKTMDYVYSCSVDVYEKALKEYNELFIFSRWFTSFGLEMPVRPIKLNKPPIKPTVPKNDDISLTDEERAIIKTYIKDIKNSDDYNIIDKEII